MYSERKKLTNLNSHTQNSKQKSYFSAFKPKNQFEGQSQFKSSQKVERGDSGMHQIFTYPSGPEASGFPQFQRMLENSPFPQQHNFPFYVEKSEKKMEFIDITEKKLEEDWESLERQHEQSLLRQFSLYDRDEQL